MQADLIRLCVGTGSVFAALIFLRAALHKTADLPRFEGVLADYALLPAALLWPATRIMPVLELFVAALLILEQTRALGALGAGLLFSAYAVAMGVNLARGRTEIDCGCGGAPEPLNWGLVARNLGLLALIAPAAAGFGTGLVPSEAVAAWAIAVLAIVGWGAVEQLLANAGRMADDRRNALASSFGGAE